MIRNPFILQEDGYFAVTKAGYIALIAVMVILIAVAAVVIGRKQKTGKITAKKLAVAGITLALGVATSYLEIIKLPWGGSVTLFSMFFICYIGYLYGVGVGFMAAFAYSLLQFVQGGGTYILSPFQACCDYFLAFTALGISSFWYKKKYTGMMVGYIVAILVRGLFHTIGGYLYWMDYMPEEFPQQIAFLYPICYNYLYILIEGAITVAVMWIPPVRKGLMQVQKIAWEE